jgi:hypothetical protein
VSGQRSRVRRSAGKLYGHAGGAQRRTDGSAHTGTAAAEEGAQIIVRIAPLGPDGPTGDASTRDGHIGCTGLTANDEDSLAGLSRAGSGSPSSVRPDRRTAHAHDSAGRCLQKRAPAIEEGMAARRSLGAVSRLSNR